MRYLFFDIECASVYKGSKICSFGYVLTDENLNILESNDIMINPKCVWDYYALEHILAHSKEYYESFPSFDVRYEEIKRLFSDDVIAFGHGVTNDVRFLNDDCNRYGLPPVDFVFYDCADIYKEFENDKEVKSLAKVSKEIGEHTQGDKHESKEDALLVYEYTKEICEKMDTSLKELLTLVGNCKGENKKGRCTYRNIKKKDKVKDKKAGKLYEYFIKYVKANGECNNKFLYGKNIAVSDEYERNHFKEMLLIIQLITNCGWKYVTNAENADVFVTYEIVDKNGFVEYCKREFDVDEAIENGAKIDKINIETFMKFINYDSKLVEGNYNMVKDRIVKIIRNEENKKVKVK